MQHNQHGDHKSDEHQCPRLAVMIMLSFISMYVLMYAMVNRLGDLYHSLNQVSMAGLMTAPVVVIEMLLMSGIAFFLFMRQQSAFLDGPSSCGR